MPRKKKQAGNPTQTELLDITARLKTGVCVPAVRRSVGQNFCRSEAVIPTTNYRTK